MNVHARATHTCKQRDLAGTNAGSLSQDNFAFFNVFCLSANIFADCWLGSNVDLRHAMVSEFKGDHRIGT
ncbi:hypothetical protein OJ913_10290, partial [Streptococcus anginosus]|nr:hypothetical protein [Streptococcus anginosus]